MLNKKQYIYLKQKITKKKIKTFQTKQLAFKNKNNMGTYKSRQIKQNIYELEELQESPPTINPKSRSPMPDLWKLNILRGKREDELKGESMPIARRRCKKKVHGIKHCTDLTALIFL